MVLTVLNGQREPRSFKTGTVRMFRKICALLLGAIITCTASAMPGRASAQAQIGPTTGSAICCALSTPGGFVGQTFRVPADQSTLTSASLNVAAETAGEAENFVLELRTYGGGVLGGTVLASSGPLSTAADPDTQGETFTLAPSSGVPVLPSGDYAIIARRTSGTNGNVYMPLIDGAVYADGTVISGFLGVQPAFDAFFQVNFQPVSTAIPTLSEWAMILLGLTLAGGAALYIQRRRLEA